MAELSIEERQIYDRQIRIWGMEAQSKLRSAKILVINFNGTTSEIAKNCVLSGMSLDILDDKIIEQPDLNNFYLRNEDVGLSRGEAGAKRIQEINCLVKVSQTKNADGNYQVVVFSGDTANCADINRSCREKHIPSYYVFNSREAVLVIADLIHPSGEISYLSLPEIIEKIPSFLQTKKKKPNLRFYAFLLALYCKFQSLPLENAPPTFIDDQVLKPLSEQIFFSFTQEFYPSLSIAAGMVTQDIVKLITNEKAAYQLFFFDANDSVGMIESFSTQSKAKTSLLADIEISEID
ncbi:unnamed protein product [Blepharisma stoltei]|uniref:THIF-type NAD/FAD binding fold domain-containing protein n=1 Tax=Blepharisma stoltei TaxID=1481888 RepID=A0AAU9IDA8_9CILI|nr:unnamed protein product [Blepharisma stoltei]